MTSRKGAATRKGRAVRHCALSLSDLNGAIAKAANHYEMKPSRIELPMVLHQDILMGLGLDSHARLKAVCSVPIRIMPESVERDIMRFHPSCPDRRYVNAFRVYWRSGFYETLYIWQEPDIR